MVRYIFNFEFLRSALFVSEKNETKHFHLFKFIILVIKPNTIVIFSSLQITNMHESIFGIFSLGEAFQWENYITVHAVIIMKHNYANVL